MLTDAFIAKVAKAHRDAGFRVRIRKTGTKRYFSIDSAKVKHRPVSFWSVRDKLTDHITSIFPGAAITSGVWSGGSFDVTYRINF